MAYPLPGHQLDHEQFTHDRLQEVLTIGLAQRIDKVNFVLPTIECYKDGFVAHLIVEAHVDIPTPETGLDPENLPLEMRGSFVATSATDDIGNAYTGYMRASHGGGRLDGAMEMLVAHVFSPALAADATTLTLTIHLLERARLSDDGRHSLGDDVLAGPWSLTFPIREPLPGTTSRERDVVAVGKQVKLDDVRLTIFSLEHSPTSFRVVARLDWMGVSGHMVNVEWLATDNLGGTYRTTNCAGAGGGPMPPEAKALHPFSWRLWCDFWKPINPEATQITLRASKISMGQPVWDASETRSSGDWNTDREIGSPGEVVIQLT